MKQNEAVIGCQIIGHAMTVYFYHRTSKIRLAAGDELCGTGIATDTRIAYQIAPSPIAETGTTGTYWVDPQQTVSDCTATVTRPADPVSCQR